MKNLKRRLYLWFLKFLRHDHESFFVHGVSVNIPSSSDLAIRYHLAKGRPYEQHEAAMINSHLAKNTNVIELGGCFGIISAVIRKRIGPTAKHLIVEARADLAEICAQNAKQNCESNATELVIGVIDYSGAKNVMFALGKNAHEGHIGGSTENGIIIETVKLSSLARRMPEGPFALICDIEGAEMQLFENEGDILARLSLLLIETHPTVYPNAEISERNMLDYIRAAGLKEIERSGNVICFSRI
jgi:FkbM family methyltransferase